MWKRIQGYGRDKEKQIGDPVLLETTYDEDQLRHIPTVSDAQIASHQPNVQSPDGSGPTHANFSPKDPRDKYQQSKDPSVASAYSKALPEPTADYHYAGGAQSGAADISPPSSPEPEGQHDPSRPRRFRSMRDVSPVDENRGQNAARSNIPVLRKAPPSIRDNTPPNTQKFWGGKVEPNSKVRWDEYSGEPTSSNAGRPGQVNPHAFAKVALKPASDRVVSGPQTNTKNTTNSSDRPIRVVKPSPVDTTLAKPREPWKGASGRVEIVPPIKDLPTRQPLKFERKPDPKATARAGKGALNSPTTPVQRGPPRADTARVAGDPDRFDVHEDPIKPIVPLKVGRNSPPRSIASPTSPHNPVNQPLASPISLHSPANQAANSARSPIPLGNEQPSAANETDQGSVNRVEPSTPANTKVARKSIETTPGSSANKDKDNGPTSRFSWTTYNTSTTYQNSPPPSPPPPLPTATPELDQKPIPAASAILNRRRPVPASDKVPTRKPISSATSNPNAMDTSAPPSPPSPRPDSTYSTNTQKALPRPPTEISAGDHVDVLEAQMEDLRIRRSNVHRLLQDLYNMAPPNPLITDFKRMRLVEKRKKEFEDELAEIKREEHDVGLRLHRAYRKREKADPGSESAIWIRRVTR